MTKKYKFDYVVAKYHRKTDQHRDFVLFRWGGNHGWGEVTCTEDPRNGNVIVDTEGMSLEFFYAMLEAWKNNKCACK